VRSYLSYCSQLWRPFLIENILAVYRVQRRATKYILNDSNRLSDYKSRIIITISGLFINTCPGLTNRTSCSNVKDPSDSFNIEKYIFSSPCQIIPDLPQATRFVTNMPGYHQLAISTFIETVNSIPIGTINLDLSILSIQKGPESLPVGLFHHKL